MLKLTGDVGVLECQYSIPQNRIDIVKLIGVVDVLGLMSIFSVVSWLCA